MYTLATKAHLQWKFGLIFCQFWTPCAQTYIVRLTLAWKDSFLETTQRYKTSIDVYFFFKIYWFQFHKFMHITYIHISPSVMLRCQKNECDYSNVVMSAMASQITGVSIVYSTVRSGADQRTHQSFASLAFMRGIHILPSPIAAGGGINAETCGLDDAFPPDDLGSCPDAPFGKYIQYVRTALLSNQQKAASRSPTYQNLEWPWWCVGWYHTVISFLVSNVCRNVPTRRALPNRSAPKLVCDLSQNSSAPTKQKRPVLSIKLDGVHTQIQTSITTYVAKNHNGSPHNLFYWCGLAEIVICQYHTINVPVTHKWHGI